MVILLPVSVPGAMQLQLHGDFVQVSAINFIPRLQLPDIRIYSIT
jgi:hypothetical protein